MHYYREEYSRHLRCALEEIVLEWSEVDPTVMFGCPCFRANGELFSFLVTNGLVLTHLPVDIRRSVLKESGTRPFRAPQRVVPGWVQLKIRGQSDLRRLLPLIRVSYEAALEQGPRPMTPGVLRPWSLIAAQHILPIAS